MSVLDYPRIHFNGRCLINAATGNSNAVAVNIDTANVVLGPDLIHRSDQEGRAWMMEGFRAKHPLNNHYRWYLNSGWNYFGDLSFEFKDVTVCGVTRTDGTSPRHDALIGQPVAILGSRSDADSDRDSSAVLCDVDPTNPVLTQLFLGEFSVGDDALGLTTTQDLRAFSRWVGWRNATVYQGEQNFAGAGATWQFAIPADDLIFYEADESPVLTSLKAAANSAEGIVVQFALFLPVPGISDEELISRFRLGDFVENPVAARVVGTIGVWKDQELETAPAGRVLLPAYPTVIGPATAQVQRTGNVVSLNLVTTFPEADFFSPPAKYDFGPVRLGVVVTPGSAPIEISDAIPYDYAAYKTYGGIVDVPYRGATRDQLDNGALVLLFNPDVSLPTTPLVSETGSTVTVETDDRGLYLDVGDVGQVRILVRERGGPPSRDVTVYFWEYQSVVTPPGAETRATATLTLVTGGSGLTPRIEALRPVVFPAGKTDPLPVNVTAKNPGPVALAMTFDGSPLPAGYPWATASYAGLRVMPVDDFSAVIRTGQVPWDYIFDKIFKYYYVIFPAMSTYIRMNDQHDMEAHAEDILEATDPDPRNWASTLYMPISRDLSPGKRLLIEAWVRGLP
jgi:hypothetical protein